MALGPLAVEAGIFAFLLLVITSSAVAELHGRDTANKLVLIGFVPLIASLLLTLVVLAVPASPEMDPARLSAFDLMMKGTPRIWIAGIIAYGISQFLNVTIFSWLKGREGGSLLWLRAGAASVLSQIVDTCVHRHRILRRSDRQLLAGQMWPRWCCRGSRPAPDLPVRGIEGGSIAEADHRAITGKLAADQASAAIAWHSGNAL